MFVFQSGLTPLHVASFMGCMNIVIYLLQHNANPDVPTVRGETPLHLAARANQTDIIRILLRNGAQVDAKARVSNIFSNTPLLSEWTSSEIRVNIVLYNIDFLSSVLVTFIVITQKNSSAKWQLLLEDAFSESWLL